MTNTTSTIDYVVAFTKNRVYAGRLDGGTLVRIGADAGALRGQHIHSATMVDPRDGQNKVYAVDGTGARIVNVLEDTVINWAGEVRRVGRGKLPISCALVTRYSGRIVLARTPENGALFFMSRKFDPLDWQFGAAPISTTAIAGTDPTIGAPGDSIVALIPVRDDYLVFACASSMYIMVGDPGYGGVVVKLPGSTGILGPKAWCVDDQGWVWYMGPEGLHVIQGPNSQPEYMSAPLSTMLDRVDTTQIQVELCWNAKDKLVHIFLTPPATETADPQPPVTTTTTTTTAPPTTTTTAPPTTTTAPPTTLPPTTAPPTTVPPTTAPPTTGPPTEPPTTGPPPTTAPPTETFPPGGGCCIDFTCTGGWTQIACNSAGGSFCPGGCGAPCAC